MPMRKSQLQIFQGLTQRQVQKFVMAELMHCRERGYTSVVIPCVGRFSIAAMAIAAGFAPNQVLTSDISLFSSVLGYLLSGQDLGTLEIDFHEDLGWLRQYVGTPRLGAAVFYSIKWCQFQKAKNFYLQSFAKELARDPEGYMNLFQAVIDDALAKMAGLHYEMADVVRVVETYMLEPDHVIYLHPPSSQGTFSRMFDTGKFLTWNKPGLKDYVPKTSGVYLATMASKAKALVLSYEAGGAVAGNPDATIVNVEYKANRVDRIVSNRAEESVTQALARKETAVEGAGIQLLPWEFEFNAATRIWFVSTTREKALYYQTPPRHPLRQCIIKLTGSSRGKSPLGRRHFLPYARPKYYIV
jgi:hypothetical protein